MVTFRFWERRSQIFSKSVSFNMSTTLQWEVTLTKLFIEDKVALMGKNRTQSCVGREWVGMERVGRRKLSTIYMLHKFTCSIEFSKN